MIELDTTNNDGARIRVIGVGGGGGNAINNMISRGLTGVDFIIANTDKQAITFNQAGIKIQVGKDTTRGLGAGANPEVGKKSIEESIDDIREALKGSDMVFVTGGMGGGTGTGGAPVVAKIGQELGALVVGIVTKPFVWEGRKRSNVAENGIKELREYVDALIVIPNQKLLDIIDDSTGFKEAFKIVDEVLYNATRGIADIISRHGYVNVDFADVRTIMKGMGDALMGIGYASGTNRAAEATHNALNSPLLDGITIKGAQGVLVNITGGSDLKMREVSEVVSIVEDAAGADCNLIHGVVNNDEPSEEIMVTVVATGFNRVEEKHTNGTSHSMINGKQNIQNEIKFPPAKVNGDSLPVQNTFRPPVTMGTAGRLDNEHYRGGSEDRGYHPSPKGTNELKKYDQPAYARRQAFVPDMNGFEPLEKTDRVANEPVVNLSDAKEQKKAMEKPAFLRKIMD